MTVDPQDDLTVRALIRNLYAATAKMSRRNPHRLLMLQAVSALMQLVRQVEAPKPRPRPTFLQGDETRL